MPLPIWIWDLSLTEFEISPWQNLRSLPDRNCDLSLIECYASARLNLRSLPDRIWYLSLAESRNYRNWGLSLIEFYASARQNLRPRPDKMWGISLIYFESFPWQNCSPLVGNFTGVIIGYATVTTFWMGTFHFNRWLGGTLRSLDRVHHVGNHFFWAGYILIADWTICMHSN